MPDQLFTFLGRALVVLAVFGVFALARRYFPAPAEPLGTGAAAEDLSARYNTTHWIVGASMMLVALGFVWSAHALLLWLSRYYSISRSGPGLQLWPQPAIWWFFPGFGATALCWELTLQLWSLLGSRHEANLYESWTNQKVGFNARKVFRWMALTIALPIGILTVLAIPMHATLRQDDIVDCGYAFSGCQTYHYKDARRMTQIDGFRNRKGKLIKRAGVIIQFQDGRRWSSADWGDWSPSVDPVLADLLRQKTGLPSEHATVDSDVASP
jgi:hypothetical protein